MKKAALGLLLLCLLIALAGCGRREATVAETIEGFQTYERMSDGTWKCSGISYKYRLEFTGRVGNGVKDTTFVYLSNRKNISFDQAVKASGVSSDSRDYFAPEVAVLVDILMED